MARELLAVYKEKPPFDRNMDYENFWVKTPVGILYFRNRRKIKS